VLRAEPRHVKARWALYYAHHRRAEVLGRLGRPAEALQAWDLTLQMDDGTYRDGVRLRRAAALARAGQVAAAVAEADALAAAPGAAAGVLYDGACVFAAAAAVAPGDADRHACRAVALLRQAVARGYLDGGHLLRDDDLAGLRRRADFAALLWDLADAARD
jgi:hypothetical protein